MATMDERRDHLTGLVVTSKVINEFNSDFGEIAKKLHKIPDALKEEMDALTCLIYEARARGDKKVIVIFNENGGVDVAGYKK